MRVYLAGPMRGIPEYNFPAFLDAARRLRGLGFDVWSPAENDLDEGFVPEKDEAKPLRHYMKKDLAEVLESDAVVVLPGWEESTGALLETRVAGDCDIPVYLFHTLDSFSITPERIYLAPLVDVLGENVTVSPIKVRVIEAENEDRRNPKDIAGSKKTPIRYVPPALQIIAAGPCAEGAAKYGPFNWREIPIQLMNYLEAMERHLAALRDGQDYDASGFFHIGHIAAGCAIVADAHFHGTLIDDRPPAGPAPIMLEELAGGGES